MKSTVYSGPPTTVRFADGSERKIESGDAIDFEQVTSMMIPTGRFVLSRGPDEPDVIVDTIWGEKTIAPELAELLRRKYAD